LILQGVQIGLGDGGFAYCRDHERAPQWARETAAGADAANDESVLLWLTETGQTRKVFSAVRPCSGQCNKAS